MKNRKLLSGPVGQLLVDSGMLENKLLSIALERARENGVKIGQILLYSGLVSDRDLKAALAAQRLIRQSQISYKQAVDALKLTRERKMDHESALARARWIHGNEQIHQFAKLIMDVGLLDTKELGFCLGLSIRHGYTLGRVLIIHDKISMEQRRQAIDALVLARCGEITYEHAVAVMKAQLRTGRSVRDLLGLEEAPVNVISDDLIQSGVLTEFEVVDIIEDALQRDTLWSGPVAGSTIIANLKFAASLAINRMVSDGSMSINHAQSLCKELLLSTASVLKNLRSPVRELINPQANSTYPPINEDVPAQEHPQLVAV